MSEVNFDSYKGYVLSTMVETENGINSLAIGLSDAEAREKKYWNNKATLPSEAAIRSKFEQMKSKFEEDAQSCKIASDIQKDNIEFGAKFDLLFSRIYELDNTLGLSDSDRLSLNTLLSLNRKKQAYEILIKSPLT